MAHDLPDVGYPDDTAAVCTIDIAHYRNLQVLHRPRPVPQMPIVPESAAARNLAEKGYRPLPPLSPQAAAQAAAAAAAYANYGPYTDLSGQPQQGAVPAGFVPPR